MLEEIQSEEELGECEGGELTTEVLPPEAEAAAKADEPCLAAESAYDLGKRLWGEAFERAKGKPYPFSGPMDRRQDETLRWFGEQCQARGGDDAERWGRHWLREYFALEGYWAREGHSLGLLRKALPSFSDPPPKTAPRPTVAVDNGEERCLDVATNAEVVEHVQALLASLPPCPARPPIRRRKANGGTE